MKRLTSVALILSLAFAISFAGCSDKTEETTTEATTTEATETTTEETEAETSETTEEPIIFETTETTVHDFRETCDVFEIKSNDLVDGVWADVISNTDRGQNLSPDISWDPVDGAGIYVIYMVDPTAGNWMHWKAFTFDETSLKEGWASTDYYEGEYVGPYPPSGTHTYDIYVVALKTPLEKFQGKFDASNAKFEEYLLALDTDDDGNTGNVIAYGVLSGTFTAS